MTRDEGHHQINPCQYYNPDLYQATMPDNRLALPFRRYYWNLKKYVSYISILGLRGSLRVLPFMNLFGFNVLTIRRRRKATDIGEKAYLGLEPGEWVEVRSAEEILATLDGNGKFKGLRFTPEMMKFCGMKFKVYKRLDRIVLEATGELREIKTPTVLLENVFCDGKAHGGCDRSCFCFWREAWLRRARQST